MHSRNNEFKYKPCRVYELMTIIPLEIKPYLIPFFHKEFEGIEELYQGKRVKCCLISTRSVIGHTIMLSLTKCKYPVKVTNEFYVYLAIEQAVFTECKFYNVENGKKTFLHVPKKAAAKINEMLEDLFELAYNNRIEGMMQANKKISLYECIESFMIEYKLDDYGMTPDSIRKNIERNKINKLAKCQKKYSKS